MGYSPDKLKYVPLKLDQMEMFLLRKSEKIFQITSLKTDISHTLMRKAPKNPLNSLKNPDFLNISHDVSRGLCKPY